jgi:hypothetical protein
MFMEAEKSTTMRRTNWFSRPNDCLRHVILVESRDIDAFSGSPSVNADSIPTPVKANQHQMTENIFVNSWI